MTKAEIIAQIAEKTKIPKDQAGTVIETFMKIVKNTLANGENIYLRGFGTFEVKKRAQKTARNITKNTEIIIPAHSVPRFKPSDEFIEKVKSKVKEAENTKA